MYQLDEKIINDVLYYLATKPYSEVAVLIQSIHQFAKKINAPVAELV